MDYLKVDGCNSNPSTFDVGYPKFLGALNTTGQPILLSCEGIKMIMYLLLTDICWMGGGLP